MKRDIYRRFAFIETCLYWGAGITARQLGETFDIARQNAQVSIDAYRKKHPENLRYNHSSKRHEVTGNFQPHYINLEPRRYLNYLRGNSLSNQFWEDEEWSDLIIEDADTLFRPYLETTIVRKVVSAIQTQQALHLYYHAKTGTQRLSIAPNHLVYASQRYHLRAYCYDWHKHIDLVLSRILEAEFSDEDWVSDEEDEDWNNYITLKFSPNPALPAEMQETLLLDFRLRNNVYSLTVRKALEAYVLREMERLDWRYKIPLWVRTE